MASTTAPSRSGSSCAAVSAIASDSARATFAITSVERVVGAEVAGDQPFRPPPAGGGGQGEARSWE